jgi:hypothetical protein
MKQDTKETEKLAELLKKADGHPIIKKMLEEEAERVLYERLLVAGKLRTAIEEAERVITEHQKKVDALVAELAEYDKGRIVILDKLSAAKVELAKARQSLEWERSHAKADLLSNYDPRIDEEIEFFRNRWESLLVKNINEQKRTGERNLVTEKQEVFVYSNVAAIRNVMAYCRAAIVELEKMKLTPALDAKRIEELRKNIPDENEMTENIGTKPLPGSKGFNFLSFLKSDDQNDFEIAKLGEKFKKLMRK